MKAICILLVLSLAVTVNCRFEDDITNFIEKKLDESQEKTFQDFNSMVTIAATKVNALELKKEVMVYGFATQCVLELLKASYKEYAPALNIVGTLIGISFNDSPIMIFAKLSQVAVDLTMTFKKEAFSDFEKSLYSLVSTALIAGTSLSYPHQSYNLGLSSARLAFRSTEVGIKIQRKINGRI
ncbi:UNKNOWN [Stylonychia lemnae]|uniref:Uncharacterized protein n=1 Tax=Stylonychia lemnae TaxID=5949 RepID=A0A077ZYM7_STYLE|nr:UNKNOWN [Stylonychia lemnae]|eukprot:CDW74990.1 UNKNOWN [Stylonychia lemnae]